MLAVRALEGDPAVDFGGAARFGSSGNEPGEASRQSFVDPHDEAHAVPRRA